MTVIEEWTGRHAHALRTALRLTNEAFAEQLGISPRTLTKWKEKPELVPGPFLQNALDTYLNQAPPDAKVRFAANLGLDQRRVPIDSTVLTQLNSALGDLARALARLQAENPERSPSP
ncbi:XRE family transcriptional regulator [Kribbella shirazensis]|jgi:transcriptional regulator with XRE-family HTH domain|uniref:Transcriptional regulator with XRE-family HTH domain n=1 Tax=Kribbella shirazensis TaxID=1105143 RepID=A0A7X5VBH4_9ACTN|nr:XRE family transcriptional regulator [Kribbella shirazensis]NIK58150.1 transcriptional regulator with XRE-family HTH domain [Kribbella shirazensis]